MARISIYAEFGQTTGFDKWRGAFQINGPRVRKHTVPDWVRNGEAVRQLLVTSFPHWRTNQCQAFRAGRWATCIVLFWKNGYSYPQVAAELACSTTAVRSLLQHIRRAANGMRADGSGVRGPAEIQPTKQAA